MAKRNRAERLAIRVAQLAAAATVIGAAVTGISSVTTEAIKSDPPPTLPDGGCLEVFQNYRKADADPTMKVIIERPDAAGKTMLDTDPQAVYCKITLKQVQGLP